MTAQNDIAADIKAALLDGAGVARVIEIELLDLENDELLVCGKVDVAAESTMREVSTILYQAKRRVREAVPAAQTIYLEPDVWVDPDAVQPTTSAVVMLGLD